MEFIKRIFVEGRADRKEFWLSVGLLFIVYAVLVSGFLLLNMFFSAMAGGSVLTAKSFRFLSAGASFIVTLITLFVWVIPLVLLSIRRLHDINLSAWWLLGYGAALVFASALLGWFIVTCLKIAGVIVLCLRGTKGPNKYGTPEED